MTTNHERTFEDLRSTLSEYGRIARQRWRLGLIALSLVSTAAFWYSQYLPRRYAANTVFERRDDVVLRNLVQSNSPYSFDNLKSTLVRDMTGARALAEAAADLGLLDRAIIPPEGALSNEAAAALDAMLAQYRLSPSVQVVQAASGLDTIRLRCEANDPAVARDFVVTLRNRYITQMRERIGDMLVSTRQFFQNELDRLQRDTADANSSLRERFRDYPGIDPMDAASVGSRLEELREAEATLGRHQAELEAQIAAREEFLVSTLAIEEDAVDASPNTANTPSAPPALPQSEQVIAKAIRDVEQEIADAMLVSRMTAEHPTVQRLRRRIEGLEAAREALRAQNAAAPEETETVQAQTAVTAKRPRLRFEGERLRVELEIEALRRQYDIVRSDYAVAQQRTEKLGDLYDELLGQSAELRKIQEQLGQDATTIAMWRQHMGQLDRILSAENVERGTQFPLIEEPRDGSRAISPRTASVFAVCTGAGLAVAALLVALAELMDRSFRTAGQVTRVLGIPVLESVGVIATPQVRRRRLRERIIWGPALALLLGVLLIAGGLAYTSLEQPALYQQAIVRLDDALQGIGIPGTGLLNPPEK
ncbi:MAG: hypothetical protein PVJ57_13680 [Phycisphaerae bacterium]|jgi:uncharacterized protein involved in exopolysaccharide biosynthesis